MNLNIFAKDKELKASQEEVARLVSALAAKETQAEEAKKVIEQLTAEKAELSTKIEVLTQEVATAANSANRKAAETLAAIGVPEGTVKEATETATVTMSASELEAEYKRLKATSAAAASEFYRANRDKFLKVLTRK